MLGRAPFRQHRRRLLAAAVTVAALITPAAAQATVPIGNLVQNPGADEATGEMDSNGAAIPQWATTGRMSALQYGAPAFPTTMTGSSIGGGANFFSGGIDDATSIASQLIDFPEAAAEIDAGRVSVDLRAYLGGSGMDGDNATVTVKFEDEHSDFIFGTLEIGPVTAAQRGGQTTLLPRSAAAQLPAMTRRIRVTITATRTDGQHNNGYADNVSVVLELEAKGDTATVAEDAIPTAVDVLANDRDANSVPRKVASVSQPANGAVAITGGGSGLTYAPKANYCNSQAGGSVDTFTYTLNSGGTATVAMTVTCVDDAPTAVNDTTSVAIGSGPTALDVLANDTDPDGGARQILAVTQAAHGAVAITGGGSGLTYMPKAGYCDNLVSDAFTYTLNGGSTATVAVRVPCADFSLPSPCPAKISAAANILGTGGNDRLVGTGAADVLQGLAGNDCLSGGLGNDRLDGGTGNDLIYGEQGNDRLAGSSGSDKLRGSSGNDSLSGGSGDDGTAAGAGNDTVLGGAGDDRLTGSAGADRLSGGSGGDRFSGGSGADRISARDGIRDTINCGSGRDRVTADRRDRVSRNCERVSRG